MQARIGNGADERRFSNRGCGLADLKQSTPIVGILRVFSMRYEGRENIKRNESCVKNRGEESIAGLRGRWSSYRRAGMMVDAIDRV